MSRHRLRAEDGFGLVELLVVVLIIGVLVAIAVPTLLNQRGKAQDANAKSVAATAAKAATSYGLDHGGFEALDAGELGKVEKSLDTATTLEATGAAKTFTVSVKSTAGTTFSITRAGDGTLTRDCAPTGSEGCRESADARGNRW